MRQKESAGRTSVDVLTGRDVLFSDEHPQITTSREPSQDQSRIRAWGHESWWRHLPDDSQQIAERDRQAPKPSKRALKAAADFFRPLTKGGAADG
jgi:hypothetical protein